MDTRQDDALYVLLEENYLKFNTLDFIARDPISIPHQYTVQQDIEISGLLTAIISWGNRKSIIKSAELMMRLMENKPYDFIRSHTEADRKVFEKYVHRTFQYADVLCIMDMLQKHFKKYDSLEFAFLNQGTKFISVKDSLTWFHDYMFNQDEYLTRTKKHIATPVRGSTCKRLNMFLRWMVRKDKSGVDFGIWKNIPTKGLMIPLDVHVEKICRQLGLLNRKQRDWYAVEEITSKLSLMDPHDPVKYDYALFGMGILENRGVEG
jgi:uncharacterized protein (TIGR02757 family)